MLSSGVFWEARDSWQLWKNKFVASDLLSSRIQNAKGSKREWFRYFFAGKFWNKREIRKEIQWGGGWEGLKPDSDVVPRQAKSTLYKLIVLLLMLIGRGGALHFIVKMTPHCVFLSPSFVKMYSFVSFCSLSFRFAKMTVPRKSEFCETIIILHNNKMVSSRTKDLLILSQQWSFLPA
jgi:hypothetical protein